MDKDYVILSTAILYLDIADKNDYEVLSLIPNKLVKPVEEKWKQESKYEIDYEETKHIVKITHTVNGKRHRHSDFPSRLIFKNSKPIIKDYYKFGVSHRESGLPSSIDEDGMRIWSENGTIYQIDGPLIKFVLRLEFRKRESLKIKKRKQEGCLKDGLIFHNSLLPYSEKNKNKNFLLYDWFWIHDKCRKWPRYSYFHKFHEKFQKPIHLSN